MVGIVSNTAAIFAQRNLEMANASSQSSIARLSSGNAIIRASDDVAGLAVGTVLATDVSTLKTVLTGTSQANSLLSIADGGLKNINDILQRQKSLAVSAVSGSLSNNERAFLNEEFTALTSEINRLVSATEFNGIKLIDGSIKSSSGLATALPAAATDFITSGTGTTTALTTAGFVGNAFAAGTVTETNDAVIGTLSASNFEVTGAYADLATDEATFMITIEGVSFQSEVLVHNVANTSFRFTEIGGTLAFDLDMAATAITSIGTVNTTAAAIKADLLGLTIHQQRGFAETAGNIPLTAFDGSVLAGAGGADFILRSDTFNTTSANTAPTMGNFTVTAETATTNGKISTTIDGVTFSTVLTEFDSNTGTNIDTANGGNSTSAGIIYLYKDGDSTTNPNDRFTIDLNAASLDSTGIDMDTAASATALQTALNQGFGSGAAGGLDFQTGTVATDKVTITLDGAATSDIYKDADGVAVTLTVSSAGVADASNGGDGTGAVLAGNVIDRAINTITTIRAKVGAFQSRFDFAASAVASSIQNTEAARSDFLDADIAGESTAFATAQVRLQASISVLAQANQLPQNLLKLIG